MKKLINSIETVLDEQLSGFVKAHSDLTLNTEPVYIYRTTPSNQPKVALISGGGVGTSQCTPVLSVKEC